MKYPGRSLSADPVYMIAAVCFINGAKSMSVGYGPYYTMLHWATLGWDTRAVEVWVSADR